MSLGRSSVAIVASDIVPGVVDVVSMDWLATGLESPESFATEHQVEARSEEKVMRMQFVRDPSSDGRQTVLHLVAFSPSPLSSHIFSAQHVLHPPRGTPILSAVRSSRKTDSLLCPMAAPLRLRCPRALHLQGSVPPILLYLHATRKLADEHLPPD